MTKKWTNSQPALALRPRGSGTQHVADGSGGAAGADRQANGNICYGLNDQFGSGNGYAMFQFGSGTNNQTYPEFHTTMSPEMQYSAEMQQYFTGEDNDNLLTTWMSGQIAESGDLFDDACYYVQDEFFAAHYSETHPGPWGFSSPHQNQWHCQPNVQSSRPELQHVAPVAVSSSAGLSGPHMMSVEYATPAAQDSRPSHTVHRPIRPKGETQNRQDAPPDTFQVDEGTNGRGRKRALSPEARLAARRVRSMRACGRCHALKGKCEIERPCKPCRSRNKRSLDFPCMQELPQDRWTHLFTDDLYGHLDLKSGGVFENMPKPFRGASNEPFTLRLHQYFDDPELTIPVVMFEPKSQGDINKSVFPIASNGKTMEVQATDILSPPLVPAINDQNFAKWTQKFRWSVRRWLDCAEIYDDIQWHSTFFREEHGKPWPRTVFAHVCQYFHKVEWGACDALKSSLQSTVFAYMLGHSFYVPHEDIHRVLDRTRIKSDYNGNFMFVSPIYVDRFIKAMLYPFFRVSFARSLKALQALCAPHKHSKYARDQILATSIVLLIVAGSQQSKAVEKAVARRRRGHEIDWTSVHTQICEIEEWIIDLMLQLWEYKFPADIRWASDDPQDRSPAFRAKIFGLYEKFEESYSQYRDTLQDLPTHIPEQINERTFGATNIDRILKRFHQCVFPPLEQKNTSTTNCQSNPVPKPEPDHNPFSYIPVL